MTLAQTLLDHGLIQFGWFQRHGARLPFALDFELLASYPALLARIAAEAQAALADIQVTRLVCPAAALPLGVAYALRSGVPLVYSRGTSEQPVFDLIGAYDIGHPTLLLANALDHEPLHLIAEARRVGLDIRTALILLELRPLPPTAGLRVVPLLRMADVVDEAAAQGRLAPTHAQAVLDWIAGA